MIGGRISGRFFNRLASSRIRESLLGELLFLAPLRISGGDVVLPGGERLGLGVRKTIHAKLHVSGTENVVQFIVQSNLIQTQNLVETHSVLGVTRLAIAGNGRDFILDTTIGTKWGDAVGQKQSWWGVAPITQPSGIVDADGTLADLTTKFNVLLSRLELMGLLAVA